MYIVYIIVVGKRHLPWLSPTLQSTVKLDPCLHLNSDRPRYPTTCTLYSNKKARILKDAFISYRLQRFLAARLQLQTVLVGKLRARVIPICIIFNLLCSLLVVNSSVRFCSWDLCPALNTYPTHNWDIQIFRLRYIRLFRHRFMPDNFGTCQQLHEHTCTQAYVLHIDMDKIVASSTFPHSSRPDFELGQYFRDQQPWTIFSPKL